MGLVVKLAEPLEDHADHVVTEELVENSEHCESDSGDKDKEIGQVGDAFVLNRFRGGILEDLEVVMQQLDRPDEEQHEHVDGVFLEEPPTRLRRDAVAH